MNLWGITPGATVAVARPRGGPNDGGDDGAVAADVFALVLAGQTATAPMGGEDASGVGRDVAGLGSEVEAGVGSGVEAATGELAAMAAPAAPRAGSNAAGVGDAGVSGDPVVGSAISGNPVVGDAVSGNTVSGSAVSGDVIAEEAGATATAKDASGVAADPSLIPSSDVPQLGADRAGAATRETAVAATFSAAVTEATTASAAAGATTATAGAAGSGTTAGAGADVRTASVVVASEATDAFTSDAASVQPGAPEAPQATRVDAASPSTPTPPAGVTAASPAPIPTPTQLGSAPSSAAAPPAPTAAPPLAPQLRAPVLSLVTAEPGRHAMVLRVSPESLGPITVTAHISGSAVTVELATGTPAAHEAIRALLGELRRDLAALAPFSSVSLAAGDDPSPTPSSLPTVGHQATPSGPGGFGAQTSGGGSSGGASPQTPGVHGNEHTGRASDPDDTGIAVPHRPAPLEAGRIDLYA
ncbi:flagellar hook-length control protein FliK [Microbacterium arborescens]|uniref:flagellar hook-length control protein FliK n=1 Tax=Microbacterium arborescens TaxID=33883 RepID=UPI0025A29071|nr:flagellar hook-length control protein FliK [Microbacterium arborescens]WJM15603.1 flagellar hook-length control protein FliK [Microbacterium arborescens]